jgi:hypothetical protein
VLSFGILLDRHLLSDPGKRDTGLGAATLSERGRRDLRLTGDGGRGGQHTVGGHEIGALADALAGQPRRPRNRWEYS